ncbi:hypothetical protein [Kaistia defluvii]|uniref:Uncharacterized protein n=1 Tax=Kaistia defluvii TaxID=410841 RepID=A0ABV2R6D5_9HYPH
MQYKKVIRGGILTIAIALQVHDGVVLASDSALTLSDPSKATDNTLNVYNNGNKIFNLRKGLPIGAVFYGAGSIGNSSTSPLIKDLRKIFTDGDSGGAHKGWKLDPTKYTIEQICSRAQTFIFDENFAKLGITTPGTQFGMIIAGYSAGAQLSETWSFVIENGQSPPPTVVIPQGAATVFAGGDPELISRI